MRNPMHNNNPKEAQIARDRWVKTARLRELIYPHGIKEKSDDATHTYVFVIESVKKLALPRPVPDNQSNCSSIDYRN